MLDELDCYVGNPGGTMEKIAIFRSQATHGPQATPGPQELSIMPDGGCLVRGHPESKAQPYDMTYISDHCDACGKQHKWRCQSGYLQAAIPGLYDEPEGNADNAGVDSPGGSDPASSAAKKVDVAGIRRVEALLGEVDGSHACHNTPCCDIFHIIREFRKINLRRAACVRRGWCTCLAEGWVRGRLALKWAGTGSVWGQVKKECDEAKLAYTKMMKSVRS